MPGPTSYDPRRRPWYVDAFKDDKTLLTGPYIFFATGEPGYTLHTPTEGRPPRRRRRRPAAQPAGAMLAEQRLGQSGLTFLFNDAGRIVGHPEMGRLMDAMPERSSELPRLDAINLPGLSPAIRPGARADLLSSSLPIRRAGPMSSPSILSGSQGSANIHLAVVAPLDEFFSTIISERRTLFAIALAFVLATLPLAFWLGSLMARSLRSWRNRPMKFRGLRLRSNRSYVRSSTRSRNSAVPFSPCEPWSAIFRASFPNRSCAS